jgi:hypothetical protein
MSSEINLKVLPLNQQTIPDPASTPGVKIARSPRRTARGRHNDQIILYLELIGNAPLPANQRDQLLEQLVETYYKTSGSATAAIRRTAETLNQFLLNRNQRAAASGKQAIGLFSILVKRGDNIFLGHSGPMHAFLVNPQGVEHMHDYNSTNRGLGLGRTTPMYYAQAVMQPGDSIFVTSRPGSTWASGGLKGLHATQIEKIRGHLLEQSKNELSVLIIQASGGSGEIQLLDLGTARSAEIPQSDRKPTPPSESAQVTRPPAEAVSTPIAVQISDASATAIPEEKARQVASTEPQSTQPSTPTSPETQGKAQAEARPKRRERISLAPVFQVLLAFWRAIGSTTAGARQAVGTSLQRVLPDESLFTLPASVMVFIAIAVPVVVVTIASVVYLQRGRTAQYIAKFAEASQAAGFARSQEDPQVRSDAWQSVLAILDEVDTFKVTNESLELRREAQAVFDQLDIVVRLDFLPAIDTSLPNSANITAMVSAGLDLYIFDSANGRVSRAVSSVRGYQLDGDFLCEQASSNSPNARLVDISTASPGNSTGATILALNEAGGLIACIPDSPPVDLGLTPPAANWSSPSAITTNRGNTYILDPETRSVWIYWNGGFDQPPDPFFNGSIPEIDDVIDITVDRDDLYLLHADGHITLCTYSSFAGSPTRCDSVPYLDSRTGRENQEMVPETAYTQILASEPPDPSLFLLDPKAPALYHFSLRLLNYQRQFRPLDTSAFQPDEPNATAFALNPDMRLIFLASGNRVFYAAIP